MTNEYFYEVDIKWDEKRKGTMSSPVLNHSVEVATPPEFPGGMEGTWSPEHLFVASVSSCLMTTFLAIAENSKLDFSNFEVKAIGKIGEAEEKPLVGESTKFMISDITLQPLLVIDNEKDRERAGRILQKAEAVCLVSHSIKTKIVFNPEVVVGELA